MTLQLNFFDGAGEAPAAAPNLPKGFRYRPEVISSADEEALLASVRVLPFQNFEFHGHTGNRRVVSFGWRYDYAGRRLQKADDIPRFLLALRLVAAAFAGVEPETFQQALVTEYGPGAGIGWHRDKAAFGQVIGVSLLASCVFRLRRAIGGKWERVSLRPEPRSVYLLSGTARSEWEHSIPPVNELRYSITFRSLRESVDREYTG
jgi:alkylated DNA repair dioxygenase AlkB